MKKTRQLAAIMFTDIEGYTSLMQENETQAVKVREKHRNVFQSNTAKYEGRIIQYYGDGTLSIFSSLVHAVNCAVEMQSQFREGDSIPVRIGIHLGDIIVTEEDIIGNGVNLASRVESLAVAGSVLISEKVFAEIKNQENFKTKYMGEFHFKNDEKPRNIYAVDHPDIVVPEGNQLQGKTISPIKGRNISEDDTFKIDIESFENLKKQSSNNRRLIAALLAVIVIMGIAYLKFGKDVPNQSGIEIVKSIAVLPFVNMSGDKEQEYFSDGITEQIITNLSHIQGFRVIARTSIMKYKGTEKSIAQIGDELNVSHILEGSIRKAGNKVRITGQLINVSNESNLWAGDYDEELDDIFSVQDDVSRAIVNELSGKLIYKDDESVAVNLPTNPEAYDLYLKGNYFHKKYGINRQEEDFYKAEGFLQDALALDSNYVDCIAELADLYDSRWFRNRAARHEMDSLRSYYLTKAYLADSTSAKVCEIMGWQYLNTDSVNFDLAFTWFKKAIEKEPYNFSAIMALGYFYNRTGLYAEALPFFERAKTLDPLSTSVHQRIGFSYQGMGEHEKAIEYFKEAISLDPTYRTAYTNMAISYDQLSEFDLAEEYLEKAEDQLGDTMRFFRILFKASKNELEASEYDGDSAPILALLGQNDQALQSLTEMVKDSTMNFLNFERINRNWYFDKIRNDHRFQEILQVLKEQHDRWKRRYNSDFYWEGVGKGVKG